MGEKYKNPDVFGPCLVSSSRLGRINTAHCSLLYIENGKPNLTITLWDAREATVP